MKLVLIKYGPDAEAAVFAFFFESRGMEILMINHIGLPAVQQRQLGYREESKARTYGARFRADSGNRREVMLLSPTTSGWL